MHQEQEPNLDLNNSVEGVLRYPYLGSVVIGRNEASNLARCIRSLRGCGAVVYVDSCSVDGSAALAAQLGAQVVELTAERPFTAARARNAGFRTLYSLNNNFRYVQFVDGDCEVLPGWIGHALEILEADPGLAAVCGRRSERYPDASIYNTICDREWDTPIGEADACGGDAMMKIRAFCEVGGFTDVQIAHEEPELCGRLRRAGWRIRRTDHLMTLHDAGMKRIAQFYKRSRRAGFGIAQCLVDSGCEIDAAGRAIIRRSIFWSIIVPVGIFLALSFSTLLGSLSLIVYPLQIVRHATQDRHRIGGNLRRRVQASALFMVDKFAVTHGCLEFCFKHLLGVKKKAIFYK